MMTDEKEKEKDREQEKERENEEQFKEKRKKEREKNAIGTKKKCAKERTTSSTTQKRYAENLFKTVVNWESIVMKNTQRKNIPTPIITPIPNRWNSLRI